MNIFISAFLLMMLFSTVSFVLSIVKQRNDIADTLWGLSFIFLNCSLAIIYNVFTLKTIIILTLIIIWGTRLFTHIYKRNINKGEDFRYKGYREIWGKSFYIRSYFQIYILQGICTLLISLPVILLIGFPQTSLGILNYLGLLVWIFGFIFESVSDKQLASFLKTRTDNTQIMDKGLWKYSRHPNYFGEVTQWWGIFLITLFTKYILFGILGPITISILVLKVSGIPMLEKHYKDNLKYQEYKKHTSIFIPFFNS